MHGRGSRTPSIKNYGNNNILGIVLFFIVTVQERSFFLFVVEKENE